MTTARSSTRQDATQTSCMTDVYLALPLDYETKSKHTLSVVAIDSHGSTFNASFVVAITDENDQPKVGKNHVRVV